MRTADQPSIAYALPSSSRRAFCSMRPRFRVG
jgi:hypothetical protein